MAKNRKKRRNLGYNCFRDKTKKTLQENFPHASTAETLNEEERDKQYRQILQQLQLNQNHNAHLKEACGLGDFIDYIGFRSWEKIKVSQVSTRLPGIVDRNGWPYLWGQTGIFLPIHNELGQIIAFQLLVDNEETDKYEWGSSAPVNGKSPHLDNDEMPLAFCRPKLVKSRSLGLAEGILKAWSTACHLEQIVIGAPGAAWDCSPKLFKRYLEKVASENSISLSSLVVDLYVDEGMLNDEHIMLGYHQTIKLLQQWGCQVRIGWWEELTEQDLDIDDLVVIVGRNRLTYISVSEWMKLWSEDMRHRLLDNSVQDTSNWQAPVQHPDRSELGYWKKVKGIQGADEWQWIPKAGFSFAVEREILGTNNNEGGLVLRVRRSYDSIDEQDRVLVPIKALQRVSSFINCLGRSTGKLYFTNNLKPYELHSWLHKELTAYRARGGKAYKLSECLGRQSDGTWVFPNCQISEEGNLITPEESGWLLNDGLIAREKIPTPRIHKDKEPNILPRLVLAMRKFFGNSGFMPAFFTAAFTVAGLFYDEIQEKEGFFPVLELYGDAGTGKTVAATTALSLLGFDQRTKISKASESTYYKQSKLMGGLTQLLDDPDKTQISWICQQIKTHFSGGSRLVRQNNQDPHSPLIIASNYSIGDNNPIILSWLIRLRFEASPDPLVYQELHSLSCLASSALPDLIKLGYPQQVVKDLELQLIFKLPEAHARLASSLALIGYYALRLAELSEVSDTEVWAYISLLMNQQLQVNL